MTDQQLIQKLIEAEKQVVPTLFKPVQFNIIKKLNQGKQLSENEKRYLRGKLRDKLTALEALQHKEDIQVNNFLNSIGSYYITGLEALKHNGYGWFFETKVVEIINTKIDGNVRIAGKRFIFKRIRSLGTCLIDKKTGLRYATNEQIIKDAKATKNEYVKSVWMDMLKRYGNLFAKNIKQSIEEPVDYEKYGV